MYSSFFFPQTGKIHRSLIQYKFIWLGASGIKMNKTCYVLLGRFLVLIVWWEWRTSRLINYKVIKSIFRVPWEHEEEHLIQTREMRKAESWKIRCKGCCYQLTDEVRTVNILFLKLVMNWVFNLLFISSVYQKTSIFKSLDLGVNLWMLIRYSGKVRISFFFF